MNRIRTCHCGAGAQIYTDGISGKLHEREIACRCPKRRKLKPKPRAGRPGRKPKLPDEVLPEVMAEHKSGETILGLAEKWGVAHSTMKRAIVRAREVA